MKRLSPSYINRLLVFLALIAPWVYIIGSWLCYYAGAHGSASTPLSFDGVLMESPFWNYGVLFIAEDVDIFFPPFEELLRYLATNEVLIADSEISYALFGYLDYAFFVVLVDLVLYIALFIPRIIKKLVDMFEGGLNND